MIEVLRRTKIVATLGPATESDEALDSIVKAGVDVVRLNFSHGNPEDHIARSVRSMDARQPTLRIAAASARPYRAYERRHRHLPARNL